MAWPLRSADGLDYHSTLSRQWNLEWSHPSRCIQRTGGWWVSFGVPVLWICQWLGWESHPLVASNMAAMVKWLSVAPSRPPVLICRPVEAAVWYPLYYPLLVIWGILHFLETLSHLTYILPIGHQDLKNPGKAWILDGKGTTWMPITGLKIATDILSQPMPWGPEVPATHDFLRPEKWANVRGQKKLKCSQGHHVLGAATLLPLSWRLIGLQTITSLLCCLILIWLIGWQTARQFHQHESLALLLSIMQHKVVGLRRVQVHSPKGIESIEEDGWLSYLLCVDRGQQKRCTMPYQEQALMRPQPGCGIMEWIGYGLLE
jgi:hypothetical protein